MSKFSGTIVLIAFVLGAQLATAQQPPRQGPRAAAAQADQGDGPHRVVLGAYTLFYTGFGSFFDPDSQSTWVLADAALGLGGALHVEAGPGLFLGVDVAMARTPYERRPIAGSSVIARGDATVGTFVLNGRLSRGLGIPIPGVGGRRGVGGLGGLGGYLTGSVGALSYWLEDMDGVNTDLAFAAGAGLEYDWSSGRGAFVEWKQFWAFHEREGVESGTANHSRFELGARVPLRG